MNWVPRGWRGGMLAILGGMVWLVGCSRSGPSVSEALTELQPGLGYTNVRRADVPWSFHVVRVSRKDPSLALTTVHAAPGAVGLVPLSEQLKGLPARVGQPVAAINGDFYQRDRELAGDPRGLQIVAGDLISGPNGGTAFWVDRQGEPRCGVVESKFQVTWPDGVQTPFVLNAERPAEGLSLLTPAVGTSTPAGAGREWILELARPPEGVILAAGQTNQAVIREQRESGGTPLAPGRLVLSAGPKLAARLGAVPVGSRVSISTATFPDLTGAPTGLGGGPALLQAGRRVPLPKPAEESYEFSTMLEQHPRSAVGWNAEAIYLVTVDGRQEKLSVGMTLEELTDVFRQLGCTEAMNLDGGGSATLWAAGTVRNSPCDGEERPIANGLVVVRRP